MTFSRANSAVIDPGPSLSTISVGRTDKKKRLTSWSRLPQPSLHLYAAAKSYEWHCRSHIEHNFLGRLAGCFQPGNGTDRGFRQFHDKNNQRKTHRKGTQTSTTSSINEVTDEAECQFVLTGWFEHSVTDHPRTELQNIWIWICSPTCTTHRKGT